LHSRRAAGGRRNPRRAGRCPACRGLLQRVTSGVVQVFSPFLSGRVPASFALDGRYSWTRLAISAVIGTVGSAGMWSVILVMPAVEAEFAVSRSMASMPYTATMLGFAVGNLLLGRVVDRFGIAPCLLGAALALAIGFAGAAMAPSLIVFTLIQGFLIGIGTAASFGPLIADVSHWFRRRRGIAVAAAASGNYLAGSIWPLLLKDIIAVEGWRTAYFTIAVISLCVMIPGALLLRPRVPANFKADANRVGIDPATGQRMTLSPRQLQWLLAVAGVGCCVAMSMPQVHIVALCADLGYGVTAGAEMLAVMVAGGVVSRLLSGVLADKIGGIRTLLLGTIGQLIALTLYLPSDGLTSLYVVSLVFGLSQGGIVPSYAIIVREYLPAEEAGRRVGIVIMATVLGMALGGWLSGAIYQWTGSYHAAFINGIAWNVLNVAIITFIMMRSRGSPSVPATA
jgi:MFS family permease